MEYSPKEQTDGQWKASDNVPSVKVMNSEDVIEKSKVMENCKDGKRRKKYTLSFLSVLRLCRILKILFTNGWKRYVLQRPISLHPWI